MDATRVVALASHQRSPALAQVGVELQGGRRFVVDLPEDAGHSPFRDVRCLGGRVFIGIGESIFVLRPGSDEHRRLAVDRYFSAFFEPADLGVPAGTFGLLAASGSELLHFSAEGQLLWRCGDLAADGVIAFRLESGLIECGVEMDPPGGWQAAWVHLDSGQISHRSAG